MQREKSAASRAPFRDELFQTRWLAGDTAYRAFRAPPERTHLAAKALAFLSLGALVLAAIVVGSKASAHCVPTSLLLQLDRSVATTMTLAAGNPCPVQVLPGSASIEALVVEREPQYGRLSTRGRTGLIYRPDDRFRGEDSFSFSLRGKTARQQGVMQVGVNVVVE